MNILGILAAGAGLLPRIIGLFKKDKKPTTLDIFADLVSNIMPQLNLAIAYGELGTKEQIDTWLKLLDDSTGSDPGAIDIFKDLPADKEEELFDHFTEFLKIYLYGRAKVPGYTLTTP